MNCVTVNIFCLFLKPIDWSGFHYSEGLRKRIETNAQCFNNSRGIKFPSSSGFEVAVIDASLSEGAYPQFCFNYIHHNPVKAHFVDSMEKGEFSSATEYPDQIEDAVINKAVARRLGIQG